MRESCFYCFSKTPILIRIKNPITKKDHIPICIYCLKYHIFRGYLNVFYNNTKNKYLLLILRRYAKLLYRANSANSANMDKIDKAIKILATTKYYKLYYLSKKRSNELLKLLLC